MTNIYTEDTNNYIGTSDGVLLERLEYYKQNYFAEVSASPNTDSPAVKALYYLILDTCQQLEEIGYVCSHTRSIL